MPPWHVPATDYCPRNSEEVIKGGCCTAMVFLFAAMVWRFVAIDHLPHLLNSLILWTFDLMSDSSPDGQLDMVRLRMYLWQREFVYGTRESHLYLLGIKLPVPRDKYRACGAFLDGGRHCAQSADLGYALCRWHLEQMVPWMSNL